MRKIIFGQPICNTPACCNNDQNFVNNCAITAMVERCGMADVKHPRHIQRALARVDNNWLKVALIIAGLSIIICYSMFIWGAASNAVIESMRAEHAAWARTLETENVVGKEQRLFRKHGYPTVINEPGKAPYYYNKAGQRCRFV
jgi:hypothetical protein